MKIERTRVPGVLIFTPDVYKDDRGYFKETVNPFYQFKPVQGNMSVSHKGVIRGLHFQKNTAKLVWVAKGSIYDLALNPETGEWVGETLTADNHKQLLVPANFAHGFQALEDDTIVCYLMDQYYNPKTEGGFNPLVPTIEWPEADFHLSDKDASAAQYPGE